MAGTQDADDELARMQAMLNVMTAERDRMRVERDCMHGHLKDLANQHDALVAQHEVLKDDLAVANHVSDVQKVLHGMHEWVRATPSSLDVPPPS